MREISFHRVMKLSRALATFPLPSCYLCIMGADEPQTAAWRSVRFVTLRLDFIKCSHLCSFSPFLSPFQSHTLSAPWSGGLTFTSSLEKSPWSSTTWRRYRPPSKKKKEHLESVNVRVVPQLPTPGVYTKFPTSVVTFMPLWAHLHSHLCIQPTNQRCEQTTDVGIKPRGKDSSFSVFHPDNGCGCI